MNHMIPRMPHACGVAAAIVVAFGGLGSPTRAVAAAPSGTPSGGTGRFPDPPRIAGPIYKPAPAGDALIRKLGSNNLVFIERYAFQSDHFYTDFINGCKRFGGNLCTLDLNRAAESTLQHSIVP